MFLKINLKLKEQNYDKYKGFRLQHGMIKANGFVFNEVAYLSDCNKIPNKLFKYLKI